MATYAIGDIQGCYDALRRLLDSIEFDPARDTLWLVGDLVNRGPQSLETLRFVKPRRLAPSRCSATTICICWSSPRDTANPIAATRSTRSSRAPDRDELLDWLRHQKMMHAEDGYAMVHAGLLPQWTSSSALELADEVEGALRGPTARRCSGTCTATRRIAGTSATGYDRLRVIMNAMARLRLCDAHGRMEFQSQERTRRRRRPDYMPWFEVPDRRERAARRSSSVTGRRSGSCMRSDLARDRHRLCLGPRAHRATASRSSTVSVSLLGASGKSVRCDACQASRASVVTAAGAWRYRAQHEHVHDDGRLVRRSPSAHPSTDLSPS